LIESKTLIGLRAGYQFKPGLASGEVFRRLDRPPQNADRIA
jgi:hypothetical protein